MKKWWSFFITLVIVGLLVWVVWDINFYEVYLLVASANLFWFLLAFLASAATFVVWNFRWMYVLKDYLKTEFWYYMQVLLAGSFFNTVTPGAGVGGEPFRAYYLHKKYKKPQSKILGYVLGDTFFRIFVWGIFIAFSVFFVLIFVNISDTLTYILEGVIIFVFLSALFLAYFILRKAHFKFGTFFKKFHFFSFLKKRFETPEDLVNYINRKMRSFSGVFRKVVKNKNNMFVGTGLSFVFWMLNFITAYFLFLSFGREVNFLSVIIVFTLGNIIGSLTPVPGGVGVVESSMVLLYSAMGIPTSIALLVAFLQRIIYYFFSLLLGGWCLVNLRRITNGGKFGFF